MEFQLELAVRQESLPNNTWELAALYNLIGSVYFAKGDVGRALLFHWQALNDLTRLWRFDRGTCLEVATSYSYIGACLFQINDYGGALLHHAEALKIQQMFVPNSALAAASFNNIGKTLCKLGDFQHAVIYHQSALRIFKLLKNESAAAEARKAIEGMEIHLDSSTRNESEHQTTSSANATLHAEVERTTVSKEEISNTDPDTKVPAPSKIDARNILQRKETAPASSAQPPVEWTTAEEDILRKKKTAGLPWEKVAECLPGRSSKSCRKQYASLLKTTKRAPQSKSHVSPTVTHGSKRQPMVSNKPRVATVQGGSTSTRGQKKSRKPKKVEWTPQEDALICRRRANHIAWEHIAANLPGRGIKECQQRYHDILKIRKAAASNEPKSSRWTRQEDAILRQHRARGLEW